MSIPASSDFVDSFTTKVVKPEDGVSLHTSHCKITYYRKYKQKFYSCTSLMVMTDHETHFVLLSGLCNMLWNVEQAIWIWFARFHSFAASKM